MIRRMLLMILCWVSIFGCSNEEVAKEIAVGDDAPDFMAKDLQGNVVILSYFKDQPVILRFWETDCKFCRADTPIINVYFEKYPS